MANSVFLFTNRRNVLNSHVIPCVCGNDGRFVPDVVMFRWITILLKLSNPYPFFGHWFLFLYSHVKWHLLPSPWMTIPVALIFLLIWIQCVWYRERNFPEDVDVIQYSYVWLVEYFKRFPLKNQISFLIKEINSLKFRKMTSPIVVEKVPHKGHSKSIVSSLPPTPTLTPTLHPIHCRCIFLFFYVKMLLK